MKLYNQPRDDKRLTVKAIRGRHWTTSFSRLITLVAVAGLVLSLNSACKKNAETAQSPRVTSDGRFVNWKTFASQNIRIMYSEGHPQESTFTDMVQGYQYLFRKLNEILGMPQVTDTITIYYYTGYGQGRELTGQEYPFVDSTAIHFWLPSFFGPTMMQLLLPRWAPDPLQHKFLKHGLISMFDLSGQKYHETTIGYQNSGYFISLDSLARDTATNSNTERYQSGEAASFCAFILGQYGPQTLKELYLCPQPFDTCVRQTLMMSVDTLQAMWLLYVRQNVPKDSLHDTLTQ